MNAWTALLRIGFWSIAVLPVVCWGAKKPVTIDAVINHHASLAGNSTHAITWAPEGTRFVLKDHETLFVYDVKTGKQNEIVTYSALDNAAVKAPPDPVFDWTNRRVGESGIQWFADGKRLLVAASGDLFIVDVTRNSFDALTQTVEVEHDPKLSPDNRSVSFRKGHDLYVADVATKKVMPLTTGGSATLLNGQLDWVYPEELYLETAHWWSPDSQSVAYLQFDIAREPVFPQVSLLGSRGILEPERYPKAGDPNAEVRLGVVAAKGGPTKWMNLGEPRGFLLARVAWSPSGRELMAERLNRVQNKLDLLLADASSGHSRVVLHEEDPQWINVKEAPRFLGTGDRFLWASERTGFFHLYVYGLDGKIERQLTSGDWEVDRVLDVDEAAGRVFYTSDEASPLERQLYSVSLDGTGKRRFSTGPGTHAISLSPHFAYYMDDYSGLTAPPRSTLHDGAGAELRVFRKPETSESDEYDILPTEIVKLAASDGTPLYARIIKPPGFKAGTRYPAIVMVYGGPGVQEIHDSWQGLLNWDQVLAQKGFLIWQLDNRGSVGRGHRFESVIYHNMGAHELEDQKQGIDYLVSHGLADPKRIGMYGWSYGGYMTLYTVTSAPGLISAAISGAPVTNWRNYDSIYTERYMGLPEDNAEAYRNTSPQTRAGNLEGTKLLILHNIEDDNVHFQNSLQMADALEKAGKQFYMVVYPQKSHGVTGPERRHLLEETTAFFEENLK
jgi:dipeptidyl-peptidase-4